jgi:ELWxxDGT repeat protein
MKKPVIRRFNLLKFIQKSGRNQPFRAMSNRSKLARKLAFEYLAERLALTGDVAPLFDFNPSGSGFSSPNGIDGLYQELNGMVYFAANNSVNGRQLWKSDGTAVGTSIVKLINPTNSEIAGLKSVSDSLYFSANGGSSGRELWKSDGTDTGTAIVKDINPGSASSDPSGFTHLSNTILFSASNSLFGRELWKSDGSGAGTVLVKDINSGQASSNPGNIVMLGSKACFVANDGSSGWELWTSDGTASGTTLVRDINPGSGSSLGPISQVVIDGVLYFRANDGSNGAELWRSDCTESGTMRVKDIRPGELSSGPQSLTNVNGILYFIANDGTSGYELWRSNGTESGTVRVKDIQSGLVGSGPHYFMTNVNGTLFFSANDGNSGLELWKSDGTEAGTSRIKDIRIGVEGSDLRDGMNAQGMLYFRADDGINGSELWRSDGTDQGTVMVANIADGPASSTPGDFFGTTNNQLFYTAETNTYGRELYVLELTSSQTSIQAAAVYHAGSSFASSGIQNALDTSKQLAKEGAEPQSLSYDNLINSSRGINGLVFDIQNLPGSPSSSLTAADFEFQMSPSGAFIEANHPPANWSNAPAPSSISVVAGSQSSPDRVVLQWPDNAIANRWLRVTVKATANTGLLVPEVYYIGHLLGETTGPSGGVYTVSFADITPIRSAVGQSVAAGSIHDIDKNGTVAFADISAMRPNVGVQLTNITIPAQQGEYGQFQQIVSDSIRRDGKSRAFHLRTHFAESLFSTVRALSGKQCYWQDTFISLYNPVVCILVE